MEFVIGLVWLLVKELCRRYLLIFIIGTIVVCLAIGGIAAVAGGAFWVAAKVTLIVCVIIGLIAGVITVVSAMSKP
ncbi:MAG: hypothetical protein P4L53_09090 [Candidatus Obscuribacterales bacterium]|nr:hypothetical protein [Candidatus Obscuribacterales bacterium]